MKKCNLDKWLLIFSVLQQEIYLVSEEERKNWHELPKHLYPNPLIFHDGRLAFKPTYLATLAMFMWLPSGFTLAIIRTICAFTLPFQITFPILNFTGAQLRISNPKHNLLGNKNINTTVLYVCNHRTLLDPLLISYCLRTPLTAVVYSLSRISEILSPIKIVRLTRIREQDAQLMHKLLSQDNLIVFPKGITCMEPYLLRFSPLFAEISENIFPVAIDCQVSMFYGTTARGLKCLDPLFLLMNPWPSFSVRLLDMVRGGANVSKDESGTSKYKIANLVRNLIAKELEFTCSRLTRKDKYLILAGNEGIVQHAGRI